MSKLSAHFTTEELCCPCCNKCEIKAELLLALEELRKIVGKPLTVTSGYRCALKNKQEGGAQSSLHLTGAAADITCPKGLTLKEFYEAALKVPAFANGGIGCYPAGKGQNTNFIHADVRKGKARWSRINGKYLAIEEAFK